VKTTPAAKLREAAHEGDLPEVKSLIPLLGSATRRAQLTAALWEGVMQDHLPVVDCLLDAGADSNAKGLTGSLVMIAAGFGYLPIVQRLLAAGADIHAKISGGTALSNALACERPDVAEYLKSQGADWATPFLLYAARKGKLAKVREALAAGANINAATGPKGRTALMLAADSGHATIVQHLLKNGANPNLKIEEWSALILAAGYGKSLPSVEALIKAGADIRTTYGDETVLMTAARAGSLPIVKRLVELGADIQARDKNHGMTAMDYAKRGENQEIVAYLSGLGATSERDVGRALARELVKEFGGKLVEHSSGFLLDSRLAGFPCQFSISADFNEVAVHKLNYIATELKHAHLPGLVIGGDKPGPREGKTEEAKSAGKILGMPVRRASGNNGIAEKFAASFCRQHEGLLKQLALTGREQVRIAAHAARFFWVGARFQAALPRLHMFTRLIQHISKPAQPERQLFENEWLLKPAPKSSAAKSPHRLGGACDQPVACPHCGTATNLMARIDLSDPALPKTPFGRLPVFWCLSCLEWGPAFFDISSEAVRPLPPKGGKIKRGKIDSEEDDLEEERIQLVPVAQGKKAGGRSKLGGQPAWIQSEDTPDCPKCAKQMAFALQLASDSQISYCDMGMLYAFVCPGCRVTASLIQSH